MKNGCMENETYRLNWVFVDKINESLFEAVANDMGKFPEKYKNVRVVERDKIIEALKNVDNYLQKIAELEQELAELKQKAIVPKFKVGQEVFIIIQDVIRATSINSFRVFENNELSYYCKYVDGERMYLELDEEEIFATKEEAEQSLLKQKESRYGKQRFEIS